MHSKSTRIQDVVSHRFLRPNFCMINFSRSMNILYLPVKGPGSAIPLVQLQPTGTLNKAKFLPKEAGYKKRIGDNAAAAKGRPRWTRGCLSICQSFPVRAQVCQRSLRQNGPKHGFSHPVCIRVNSSNRNSPNPIRGGHSDVDRQHSQRWHYQVAAVDRDVAGKRHVLGL